MGKPPSRGAQIWDALQNRQAPCGLSRQRKQGAGRELEPARRQLRSGVGTPTGKRLVVAWKAVCGATSYRVSVSGRGAVTVTKTSYTVTGKLRGRTPTVTVAPVGPDGTVGDLTTRPLAPGAS
jgi:hypothetical protein